MNSAEVSLIWKFFPRLDPVARSRILQLEDLYAFWNKQINVISRKDMEHLYIRHVLHSLSLSLAVTDNPFTKEHNVLDVGTGGGFPGIPLAILHPDCHFVLCDSIGKKSKWWNTLSEHCNLTTLPPLYLVQKPCPNALFR